MWVSSDVAYKNITPVESAMEQHVRDLIDEDVEEPFFVCDLNHVTRTAQDWSALMPTVAPFYGKLHRIPIFPDLASVLNQFSCEVQSRHVLNSASRRTGRKF